MNIVRLTLLIFATTITATTAFAASNIDPEKDPQMDKLLWDARHLIEDKKPAAAIPKCNAVIAAYKAYYGKRKERIYCTRSATETLSSLVTAVADKTNAIALSGTWADAYYMKAYALQDLHRLSDAKATLQQGLKLSPYNSQYLNELGEICSLEKNWSQAMKAYKDAEEYAPLGPDDRKADNIARARRGKGYVLVELGKLDEAAKMYERCLAENPKDKKAKAELDYVRQQQAKKKRR